MRAISPTSRGWHPRPMVGSICDHRYYHHARIRLCSFVPLVNRGWQYADRPPGHILYSSNPVAVVNCADVIIPAYASSRHDWLESATDSLCEQRAAARLPSWWPNLAARMVAAYTTNAKRYLKNEHDIEIDSGRLPLNCVTWLEWLDFRLSPNPNVEKQLITSRSTVVSHIMASVHERLQKAKPLVHLSVDLWTSPSRVSFVGICGHWIDENHTLQRMLLGLNPITQAPSRPHISYAMSTTLRSEYGIMYDAAAHRIRCIGHILNIALRAFLLTNSKEALQAAGDASGKVVSQNGETVLLRELHTNTDGSAPSQLSIAVTLRSSAILHSSFKQEVGVCLGIDKDTRWNSWFKVIDTAIAKRPKIVNWLVKNSSHFGANSLDAEDWELLGKTHSFLLPFNQARLTR
ncbi:hypothetical protein V8E54_000312 [Elaphomyces granulatus]